MKCPKCDNELVQLFTSSVCEVCNPPAQVVMSDNDAVEVLCDDDTSDITLKYDLELSDCAGINPMLQGTFPGGYSTATTQNVLKHAKYWNPLLTNFDSTEDVKITPYAEGYAIANKVFAQLSSAPGDNQPFRGPIPVDSNPEFRFCGQSMTRGEVIEILDALLGSRTHRQDLVGSQSYGITAIRIHEGKVEMLRGNGQTKAAWNPQNKTLTIGVVDFDLQVCDWETFARAIGYLGLDK